MLRALALLGLMLTSACATVTQGTTATLAVTTDPAGASCQVQRDGATIAVVNPTPGSVTISRSVRDLAIRCEKPGNLAGVTTVPAGFQAMTVGNLLVGGVIGVAVDAASGAMGTYPGNVHVSLPPDQAAIARQENEQRRRDIMADADSRMAASRAGCNDRPRRGGAPSGCEEAASAIMAARDEQLRSLDRARAPG